MKGQPVSEFKPTKTQDRAIDRFVNANRKLDTARAATDKAKDAAVKAARAAVDAGVPRQLLINRLGSTPGKVAWLLRQTSEGAD